MKRVLVADTLQAVGRRALRKHGLEGGRRRLLDEAAMIARIGEYEGLIVRSAPRVTRAALAVASRLEVIGRAGAGVDTIDVDAATERGVIVMNTPGGNTTAVAEHTLALLLALARRVTVADAALKAGRWEKNRLQGVELLGKTLGILGLGRIGAEVARRALGFRMQVLAYDPYLTREAAERLGVSSVELDELLTRSDFITIHTPLTGDTRHLIGDAELARMKPGVRLINCARGGIIDEAALVRGLASGQVGGAGIDVFEQEPPPADHPLLRFEQVVVTPHLGAATDEAQSAAPCHRRPGGRRPCAASSQRGQLPSMDAETARAGPTRGWRRPWDDSWPRWPRDDGRGAADLAGDVAQRPTARSRWRSPRRAQHDPGRACDRRERQLIAKSRGLRVSETSTSEAAAIPACSPRAAHRPGVSSVAARCSTTSRASSPSTASRWRRCRTAHVVFANQKCRASWAHRHPVRPIRDQHRRHELGRERRGGRAYRSSTCDDAMPRPRWRRSARARHVSPASSACNRPPLPAPGAFGTAPATRARMMGL